MELTHHFHVPSGVDETWAHFQDVAGLAGCFPGAQVESVDGDTFTGGCKVKLGPIALVYNGTGSFTERDEASHRMVVEAKGKDKRGNGTAAATATLTMAAASSGGTDVDVVTDLAITGKPAQFGRGLMQDVSDRLLTQFVDCLQQQLTPTAPESAPASMPAQTPHSSSDPAASDPAANNSASDPASGPAADPASGASSGPAAGSHRSEPATPASSAGPAAAPKPRVVEPPASNDALDLGATVLPVLLKSYWKPAAAGAVVVAFIVWLIAR